MSVGMCMSSGEGVSSMPRGRGCGAVEMIKLKTPGGLASNHLPGDEPAEINISYSERESGEKGGGTLKEGVIKIKHVLKKIA